jgi:integrase/recombinase XerD
MAIADAPAPERHLTDLTLEFLASLELERGLSRNTLEAYRSDLQQLGRFLAVRARDPLEVTTFDLAAFISELATGHAGKPAVAPATLQRKIACLRSFYRHLRREGLIGHDPTADLRPPRARGRLPKVLTRDEVVQLLEQPRGSTPGALRDRALLETMYACGLRATEAISLETRSGSCRSAPRRSGACAPTSTGAARGSSASATSRACSSTSAAMGSRARACTRSSRVMPAAPAWRAG